MDNHKFAFIICSNNSIMLNECIFLHSSADNSQEL